MQRILKIEKATGKVEELLRTEKVRSTSYLNNTACLFADHNFGYGNWRMSKGHPYITIVSYSDLFRIVIESGEEEDNGK